MNLASRAVTTDASSTSGWGELAMELLPGALWSNDERQLHITGLELKAALPSIKAFALYERNYQTIQPQSGVSINKISL